MALRTERGESDVDREAAVAGAPRGTRLEVVMEPTGPAWLPIAVFFSARGHAVYRVSSQKAADLRRFLSRHAKSNGIDADTLARLALVDPDGLTPLTLPGSERAALDRRVRACDRLTMQAAEHKVRLKDLVRQLMPLTPLTGDLGQADLAVLEQWLTRGRCYGWAKPSSPPSLPRHPATSWAVLGPSSGWPPPRPRCSSMPIIRRCPSSTSPPRSPPRYG